MTTLSTRAARARASEASRRRRARCPERASPRLKRLVRLKINFCDRTHETYCKDLYTRDILAAGDRDDAAHVDARRRTRMSTTRNDAARRAQPRRARVRGLQAHGARRDAPGNGDEGKAPRAENRRRRDSTGRDARDGRDVDRSRARRAWSRFSSRAMACSVALAVVFGWTVDASDDAGQRMSAATRLVVGGAAVRQTVEVQDEKEFYFDVQTSGADVVVELWRDTGIPIVYLEKEDAQWSRLVDAFPVAGKSDTWSDFPLPGAAPYGTYGSYGYLSDHRTMKIVGADAGRYWLKITNVQEVSRATGTVTYSKPARFDLKVRSTDDGVTSAPLCAWNCSGLGTCELSGSSSGDNTRCVCDAAVAVGGATPFGSTCGDTYVDYTTLSSTFATNHVPEGRFFYTSHDLWNGVPGVREKGADVTVYWEGGGDPLFLFKAGAPPTLTDYDDGLDRMYVGANTKTIRTVTPGTVYYFGVFNRKLEARSPCAFRIALGPGSDVDGIKAPTIVSMALVLLVGISFCFIVAVIKRFFYRRYLRQFREQRVQQLSMEELARRRDSPQSVGTPQDVIAGLEVIEYQHALKDGVLSGQDPTCTICLDDYAQGEKLRLFPHCKHIFHQECADLWLQTSSTCPNCRCSVMPNDDEEANASVPPSGAQQASMTPMSPGARVELVTFPMFSPSSQGAPPRVTFIQPPHFARGNYDRNDENYYPAV